MFKNLSHLEKIKEETIYKYYSASLNEPITREFKDFTQ